MDYLEIRTMLVKKQITLAEAKEWIRETQELRVMDEVQRQKDRIVRDWRSGVDREEKSINKRIEKNKE